MDGQQIQEEVSIPTIHFMTLDQMIDDLLQT